MTTTYKGTLFSADFEQGTMEFQIDGEFTVRAGEYAIVPTNEFEQQQQLIERLKINLENMVYYANQLEGAPDELWLKSFRVATVEAETLLKETQR